MSGGKLFVFFGGYLQFEEHRRRWLEGENNSDALQRYEAAHKRPEWCYHQNFVRGTFDQREGLLQRWNRTALWWDRQVDVAEEVSILAYSMGCHLAVRFALAAHRRSQATRLRLTLLAPDPKYTPSPLDLAPDGAGDAYTEASELWDGGVPGIELQQMLEFLELPADGLTCCWSRRDPVAAWVGNVERLDAAIRQVVEGCTPVEADGAAWMSGEVLPSDIHEVIFERFGLASPR